MSTRLRNLAAAFAPAVIVLAFGVLAYSSAKREDTSADWVARTHDVIERTQDVLARMIDAETGERGFIITGDSAYLEPYHGAAADVRRELALVRQLTRDNPVERARLDSAAPLLDRRLAVLDERIAIRARAGFDSARAAVVGQGGGKALMDSVRRVIAAVDADETALLAARDADRASHSQAILWIIAIGTVVAAAVALLVNVLFTRYAGRQARLATQLDARARDLEVANEQLQDQTAELEVQSTELEAANDELQVANEHLEERTREAETANRSKAEFLAKMSHELRTPLNAIVGYAELLELGVRGPVTWEQINDLKRINRSSKHLLSLINDILNFAKIEAGRVQVRAEDVSVRDTLANIVPLVAPQMQRKGLEFVVTDGDPALIIRADHEKLDQIILNLLSNAIKFTKAGGRVVIDHDADDASVQIHVRDTGRGIPPEHIESVFDPFVQVGLPRSQESGEGIGLGLAISRELARAMNGDLTVTSTAGEGSTFTLRMPRSQA